MISRFGSGPWEAGTAGNNECPKIRGFPAQWAPFFKRNTTAERTRILRQPPPPYHPTTPLAMLHPGRAPEMGSACRRPPPSPRQGLSSGPHRTQNRYCLIAQLRAIARKEVRRPAPPRPGGADHQDPDPGHRQRERVPRRLRHRKTLCRQGARPHLLHPRLRRLGKGLRRKRQPTGPGPVSQRNGSAHVSTLLPGRRRPLALGGRRHKRHTFAAGWICSRKDAGPTRGPGLVRAAAEPRPGPRGHFS